MATDVELIPVDLGEDSVPDNSVGGGLPDIPDDDYLFEVESFTYKRNDNDRPQYDLTAFVVSDCPYRGTTLKKSFVLKADSDDTISNMGRNKLHCWLLAIGIDLRKRKFKLNPAKIRKLRFMSRTVHETLPASEDGRFSARPVSRFGAVAPDPDNDEAVRIFNEGMGLAAENTKKRRSDDDEDEAPRSRKPAAKRPVDDDDDDDETPRKKPAAKRPADDDDDDEPAPARRKRPPVDDDDDDEPEPPKKQPSRRKPKDDDDEDEPAPPTRRKRPAVDDDDDDDDFPTRPPKDSKPRTRRRDDDDDDD